MASGELRAGDRVKEIPLAESLGLSRGTVREAMRELAADGLLFLIPHRGATVAKITSEQFAELYGLRLAIGVPALRSMLPAKTEFGPAAEALAELVSAAKGADRSLRRPRLVADLDLAFQQALIECSGLVLLADAFERTTAQLRLFITALGREYEGVARSIADEDTRLLQTVRAGDTDVAVALWRTKLRRWLMDFSERTDGSIDLEAWDRTYN
jgi:DNA-binding GntR family transcriptional regulator